MNLPVNGSVIMVKAQLLRQTHITFEGEFTVSRSWLQNLFLLGHFDRNGCICRCSVKIHDLILVLSCSSWNSASRMSKELRTCTNM